MGILYKQEKSGYKHVFTIREQWSFCDRDEFEDCVEFLINNTIEYSVSYGFEVIIINLKDAVKVFESTPDKYVEIDKKVIAFWEDLFNFKSKTTRPIKLSNQISEILNSKIGNETIEVEVE